MAAMERRSHSLPTEGPCQAILKMISSGALPVERQKSFFVTEPFHGDDERRVETEGLDCNSNDFVEQVLQIQVEKSKSPSCSIMSSVRSFQQNISVRFIKTSRNNSARIAASPPLPDSAALMMNVIRSPIGLGHFLAFCETEYNSEYLQLFLAVEKFRSKEDDEATYSISDTSAREGKETWREIDETVAGSIGNLTTLPLDEKRKLEMMTIWENFFNDKDDIAPTTTAGIIANHDRIKEKRRSSFEAGAIALSPNYVFLPKTVSTNTFRRMSHLHLYGADVFSEAVTAALNILHRDIFPRFIKSEQYLNMMKRRLTPNLESVIKLPAEHLLVVKAPKSEILCELGMRIIHAEGKLYNLKEILRDGILFKEFYVRLKKKGISEFLLAPRMITIFKESVRYYESNQDQLVKNIPAVQEQAWTIYLFFVAEGSSYEISLNAEQKKAIQLSLGKPTINMFFDLEAVAMNELILLFNKYKTTENYRNLAARALHIAKNILKVEAGTVRSRRSSRDHLHSILTRMNIR